MEHQETEKIYLAGIHCEGRYVRRRIEQKAWFWPAVSVGAFLVFGGAVMALAGGWGGSAILAGLVSGILAEGCCLLVRKSRLEYFNLMRAQRRVGSVEKELSRFITVVLRGLRLPLRTVRQAGEQIAETARQMQRQSGPQSGLQSCPQSGLQSGLSARGVLLDAGSRRDDDDIVAVHDRMLQTVKQAGEQVSETAELTRAGFGRIIPARHCDVPVFRGDEDVFLEHARSLRPVGSVDEQSAPTSQAVQTAPAPTKQAVQKQLGLNYVAGAKYDKELNKQNRAMQAGLAEIDSLAGGLLKVARARRAKLRSNWVDANSVVVGIVAELDGLVRRNNVRVHMRDLPCCLADAELVRQALRAIIENALEYVGGCADRQVRIWGVAEKDRVLYSVEDNGIGIEQEEIEKIFEMFYRVDPSRVGHRGIGLAVVRRIIRQHDGGCWVRSVPGKGSTFTIALPLK